MITRRVPPATVVEELPSVVPGVRRLLVRAESGGLVEAADAPGWAARLPRGGVFAGFQSQGDRLVLGPPLARRLAELSPPPIVVAGLGQRILQDLEALHGSGGAHGAIHHDAWGIEASGQFAVRPAFHAAGPALEGPAERDLGAVARGLDAIGGPALEATDMKVATWLAAVGLRGRSARLRDARSARQALVAAVDPARASQAVEDFLLANGGWLPSPRVAFLVERLSMAGASDRALADARDARTQRLAEARARVEEELLALKAERAQRRPSRGPTLRRESRVPVPVVAPAPAAEVPPVSSVAAKPAPPRGLPVRVQRVDPAEEAAGVARRLAEIEARRLADPPAAEKATLAKAAAERALRERAERAREALEREAAQREAAAEAERVRGAQQREAEQREAAAREAAAEAVRKRAEAARYAEAARAAEAEQREAAAREAAAEAVRVRGAQQREAEQREAEQREAAAEAERKRAEAARYAEAARAAEAEAARVAAALEDARREEAERAEAAARSSAAPSGADPGAMAGAPGRDDIPGTGGTGGDDGEGISPTAGTEEVGSSQALGSAPESLDARTAAERPEEPRWIGAVGVTGDARRAAEKGPGKWKDAGGSGIDFSAGLPAGPTRDMEVNEERPLPWGLIVAGGAALAAAAWLVLR
jgi:hypothetical protein